ncbi:CDK2-associated and cullin domain-containing protein 1 isoform X5 [Sceloporus undulatus]|uniref:CDK2-associated and cullin domain-containing protein 1 isoform X5 n=1 Tax=Sceloporus undulatus TaxID=8520 RepID=UPI001C4AE38C|nr:CDK2-associated and cullin domain-containing protein 1 isoform X5 [Sceloporus undulatus]
MEEESMEEEGGGGGGGGGGSVSSSGSSSCCYEAAMDDQNHNNWEAAAGGRGSLPAQEEEGGAGEEELEIHMMSEAAKAGQGKVCPEASLGKGGGAAGAGPAASSINLNLNPSASKFLMNVITIEDYKSTYWPKLDSAIDQLLTQSPGDYIPISYEQIYSCVYKCVCQQHSEQMYSDLIKKITNHLERVSEELQNKFYIETKLNRDLRNDLIKLFTEHVAEKHIYSLMQWVQMAPALFSKFIPNILPPAVESELEEYAAQDQKLQQELIQEGFSRGDQSRKRAGEELTYNGSTSCASSRGCR